MKKAQWVLILLIVFALVMCGCTSQNDTSGTDSQTDPNSNPPDTDANPPDNTPPDESIQPIDPASLGATFAISNTNGDKLITFTLPESPVDYQQLNTAIGKDGTPFEITFIGSQEATAQDNGRVNARNFDNMQGNIYQINNPPVESDQTYFLYNSDNNITENLLTAISTETTVLAEGALNEITLAKGRNAHEGWLLQEYEDGTQILLVLFEPQGENLLMSIAFKINDTIKFMDYPAVLSYNSAWRVDDGGTVDPRFFSVMFAVHTTDGIAAAISWAGAEGENTFILLETDNALEEMPDPAYRYWSAG